VVSINDRVLNSDEGSGGVVVILPRMSNADGKYPAVDLRQNF
jgi:hypothetical protein